MINPLTPFGLLSIEDRDSYKKNGYCLKNNFLDPNYVDSIRDEAKEIFAKQIRMNRIPLNSLNDQDFEPALYQLFKENYNAFIGAAKLCQHTFSMHQLAVSSSLVDNLKELGVEHPTICVKPLLFFNSPHISKIEGHFKTPAHQDWRSMQGSLNSLVVWIPLIDIDKDLGTLEIVPKSHLSGLYDSVEDDWFRNIPETEIPESEYLSIEVKKGDVLFFSAFLVHRSGNNISDNIRWSMHFRYNDANETSFLNRGFPHPYKVYHPEKELITPNFPSKNDLNTIFRNE
jgi:ectoine hydroxylase-related dioxygenase (phytanoyl-CoA dioxygenase family)